MKRIKTVITLTVLLMVVLVKPSFADESVIKDPILRQNVMKNLSITSGPTQDDMKNLVYLEIKPHRDVVKTYEGMEYAVNLRDVYISGDGNSTDFSAFEGLTKLTSFHISYLDMKSDEFPTFAVQPELKKIEYSFTWLDSSIYEKLQKTPSIETLVLRNNRRGDSPGLQTLDGLQNLPNLKYLNVWSNGITDFTIIDQFPQLLELTAFGQSHDAPDSTILLSDLPWNPKTEVLTIPLTIFDHLFYDYEGTAYLPGPKNRQVLLRGIDSNSKVKYFYARKESGDFIVDGMTRELMQDIGSIEIYTTLDEGYDMNKKPTFLNYYWASNVLYNKTFFTNYDDKSFNVITVDEKNNEIDTEYTMSGQYLSAYTISTKEIPGYTFVESSSPLSSYFDQGIEPVVTLKYKKDVLPSTDVYTVTFDTNGGSTIKPITNVESGSMIQKPENPTKAGYTFAEWTKNDISWDFASMKITEDTTLVAVWKKEAPAEVEKPEVQKPEVQKPEVQKPEVNDKGNTNNNIVPESNGNNSNTNNSDKLPATGLESNSILSFMLIGLGTVAVFLNKRISKELH